MKLHRLLLPASRAARLFNCGFVAAIAFVWPLSETACATTYTFTDIAHTTGTDGLSINDAGTVAFGSKFGIGNFGIFSGNGGPITNIALSSGPFFSFVGLPSINSAGAVAFEGALDAGGEGIFMWNAGTTSSVALTSEPAFRNLSNAVINDAGTVAFSAILNTGANAVFARNGGVTTPITSAYSTGGLSINASGRVAYTAGGGISSSDGITPRAIASGFFTQGTTPSINAAGKVAFSDGAALSISDGVGPATMIANVGGPFGAFGICPSINDLGQVAFWAVLDNGTRGIYTGADPVANKVIDDHDTLFGNSIVRLNLADSSELPGNLDINNSGQIAFHYQLANGFQGIAVATPVPEPSAAACLLVGAIALGAKRSGQRAKYCCG